MCLHACQFLDLGVFYTRLLPGHSRRHDERNRKFALSSEKLVVWVRDHLPGILLGSMVHRVLAIGPRPAADTAAAREFFYQEKKKKNLTAATIHFKWIPGSTEVQFHVIEVCRAPPDGYVFP